MATVVRELVTHITFKPPLEDVARAVALTEQHAQLERDNAQLRVQLRRFHLLNMFASGLTVVLLLSMLVYQLCE